jgi:hypothetical protein
VTWRTTMPQSNLEVRTGLHVVVAADCYLGRWRGAVEERQPTYVVLARDLLKLAVQAARTGLGVVC